LTWQTEARTELLFGFVLAVVAVLCWTWYPLRNARWLREHPDRSPAVWATAQGLVTLPVALIAYLCSLGHLAPAGYASTRAAARSSGPPLRDW